MFNIAHDIKFPEVDQINEDSGRKYKTREGNIYPSVTTILGANPIKKAYIRKWREKIGEEKANAISKHATTRGSTVHKIMEQYVDGETIDESVMMPLTKFYYNTFKKNLNENMDLIYCREQRMYSDILRLAGQADLIGRWKGEAAVIDFKTSTKRKTKSQIEDYFVQAAAYSIMFEEHQNIVTRKIIVLIGSDDGDFSIFEEDRNKYVDKLIKARDYYESISKK